MNTKDDLENHILCFTEENELNALSWHDFLYVRQQMSTQAFLHIGRLTKTLWVHSGDFSTPHIGLPCGKCADGYVDMLSLSSRSNLAMILAYLLISKIREQNNDRVDVVVGTESSVPISHSASVLLNSRFGFSTGLTHVWNMNIRAYESVLRVEQVISSLDPVLAINESLRRYHQAYELRMIPVIGTVINLAKRSVQIEGVEICSLYDFEVTTVDREECHLCREGSRRVENFLTDWNELY